MGATDVMRGQLAPAAALGYLFAGNATVTLRSQKTGAHFTYRIQAPKERREGQAEVHFVKYLAGPDNEGDYQYLGMVIGRQKLVRTRASRVTEQAPVFQALTYTLAHLTAGDLAGVDAYHEGRCGRCGRALTVPESVATGYGPECSGILGIDRAALPTWGQAEREAALINRHRPQAETTVGGQPYYEWAKAEAEQVGL